jgi:hypothetical protein
MSQYIPFLDDPIPGRQPGGIGKSERWWIERQEALEQAGYMLRPRFRPGWQPSWTGTNKQFLDFEDGQSIGVSVDTLSLTTCAFTYDISCA